ncbi:MAG: hypothetical protein WDA27_14615 [Actinomycetota bacterium]
MTTRFGGKPGIVTASSAVDAAADALKIGARFGSVVLAPLTPAGVAGGAIDDWARWVAVANVCDANGWKLRGAKGSWYCLSKQVTPHSIDFEFEPGCTLYYDLRPIGNANEDGSIFWHVIIGSLAVSSYLAAAAAEGQSYIDVLDPSGCSVGGTIILESPSRIHSFLVRSRTDVVLGDAQLSAFVATGATLGNSDVWKYYYNVTKPAAVPVIDFYSDSAKTVHVATGTRADDAGGVINCAAVGGSGFTPSITIAATVVPDSGANNIAIVAGRIGIDAALAQPFAATGGTNPVTDSRIYCPTDAQVARKIRIEGNGCKVLPNSAGGGRADKIVELAYSWDCCVSGFNVDGSGVTLLGCSFDLGGVRNRYERMVYDGHDVSGAGLTLEGQRGSEIVKSQSDHCVSANIFLLCSDHCKVEALVNGGVNGLMTSVVNAADIYGCSRNRVTLNATGCSQSAVLLRDGARLNDIDCNCDSCYNGVWITTSAAKAKDNTITARSNVGNFHTIKIDAGIKGTVIKLCESNGATDYSMDISDEISLQRVVGNDPYGIHLLAGAYNAEIGGAIIHDGSPCIQVDAGVRAHITGSNLTGRNACVYIPGAGSVVLIDSTKCAEVAGGGIGVYLAGATSTVRLGYGYDGSACTNRFANGGYASRGNVTFGSDAAVDVTWPDINGDSGTGVGDRVILTLVAASGTPTRPPLCVITHKTKFTLTPVAGDRSTYSYEIV